MNKQKPLILIDLQNKFLDEAHASLAENEQLREAILEAIDLAIEEERAILCLLFPGSGDLFEYIREALANYSHWETKYKGTDGSEEVLAFCEEWDIPKEEFQLCGVYTSLCVLNVAQGLIHYGDFRVEIIEAACYEFKACSTPKEDLSEYIVWV